MARQKQTEPGFDAPTADERAEALAHVNTDDPTAALQQQVSQMLDMLTEQQAELQELRAQRGATAKDVKANDLEAELDAELERLKLEFADVPNIGVFEQRVRYGTDASTGIRLKAAPGGIPEPTFGEDPSGDSCYWKLRWFNFGMEGRSEQFRAEGYEKVRIEDLQDPESIPARSTADEFVRRGERGTEVLGKMPRKLYDYKKKRDALRSSGLLTSESRLQDHLANSVASQAGRRGDNADQAGSFAHRKMSVTITPGERETFTA
jgi:hypothetical protein